MYNMPQTIQIARLDDKFNDLPLPHYASEGSAGMDVCAAIDEDIVLAPQNTELIPTGLAIALPAGYECQVRSRSGLAAKFGVFTLNAPGTVDSDYRGEIKVILSNFGKEPFVIKRGDRIAQLIITKYEKIDWYETKELEKTDRGEGGFGSTGIRKLLKKI
jgi:dUTP pyrophosphatase